ncbi:MAG: hypothetical protein IT569_02740 [Leptospiraceae bacterium]|nr:hypothetical protein [Leptospiraceae bacterium]
MKNSKMLDRLGKDIYILPDYLNHSEEEVWSMFLQGKYRLFLFELPGHKKEEKREKPLEFSQFAHSLEEKILEDPNRIVLIASGLLSVLALELAYKYPNKIIQCILISPIFTESRFKQFLLRVKNIYNWLKKEKVGIFQIKAIFQTRSLYNNLVKKISLLKNLKLDTNVIFILSAKKHFLNDFQTKNSLDISKNAEVFRFRNSSTDINKNDWRFKRLIFEILNRKKEGRSFFSNLF